MANPSLLARLRRQAIRLRMTATLPLRRRQMATWSSRRRAPCLVLFYHRVADEYPNDWTISNAGFREHLDLLAEDYEFVSLGEMQRRLEQGDSPRPAVHLTFDDGYADNCHQALPLLIERGIPCTYFVTLRNILTAQPFPHDLHAGQPLAPNTPEQIRALADAGIEIGGHSMTHPNFGALTDEHALTIEIEHSTQQLSELIERPIRYFAFPYGLPENITARAIEAVSAAGMKGFCSAFGGYNLPGRDAFHIRRFHGDPDLVRLRNWLTIEPRWLRREPEIRYQLPGSSPFDALRAREDQDGDRNLPIAGGRGRR